MACFFHGLWLYYSRHMSEMEVLHGKTDPMQADLF